MKDLTLPEDKEMPLEKHLIELGRRLVIVIIFAAVVGFAIFPFSNELIRFLMQDLLPKGINLIILNPMEYLFIRLKLSIVLAVIISLPLVVYEVFAFMKPGLFPSERKFFLRTVPSSVLFLIIGGIFSYSIVTPFLIKQLLDYTQNIAEPFITLSKFVDFVSFSLLIFGIIFQMPLVISFLVMGNLVRIKDLMEKRKFAYALLLVGSVFLSPDPTPIAPFLVALALVIMYEISIVFARTFA